MASAFTFHSYSLRSASPALDVVSVHDVVKTIRKSVAHGQDVCNHTAVNPRVDLLPTILHDMCADSQST